MVRSILSNSRLMAAIWLLEAMTRQSNYGILIIRMKRPRLKVTDIRLAP
jgi:hypothetical protein